MFFIMIRNKIKNMVNDVRNYFIDICLCLHLENDEKKHYQSYGQKHQQKLCLLSVTIFKIIEEFFMVLVVKSQKIVSCELLITIHA